MSKHEKINDQPVESSWASLQCQHKINTSLNILSTEQIKSVTYKLMKNQQLPNISTHQLTNSKIINSKS